MATSTKNATRRLTQLYQSSTSLPASSSSKTFLPLFTSSPRRSLHQSSSSKNDTPSSSSSPAASTKSDASLPAASRLSGLLQEALSKKFEGLDGAEGEGKDGVNGNESGKGGKKSAGAAGLGAIYGNVMETEKLQSFRANTLYSPTNLLKSSLYKSPPPRRKPPYLGPSAPTSKLTDPFHVLSLNPLDEALNNKLVRDYISMMGKIKPRAETGLTWKNQRRVGKMVRRARAMGLISRWTNQVQEVALPVVESRYRL